MLYIIIYYNNVHYYILLLLLSLQTYVFMWIKTFSHLLIHTPQLVSTSFFIRLDLFRIRWTRKLQQ